MATAKTHKETTVWKHSCPGSQIFPVSASLPPKPGNESSPGPVQTFPDLSAHFSNGKISWYTYSENTALFPVLI